MAIEDLQRYEFAALAANAANGRINLAGSSMRKHYTDRLGIEEEDPIINRAIAEGMRNSTQGHLSGGTLLQAIALYNSKFEQARNETTVRNFINYSDFDMRSISNTPYNPDNADDNPRERLNLLINEHADIQIGNLDENNPVHKKVLGIIAMLQEYRLEASLAPEVTTENVERSLEGIVSD